jgi:AAA+ superfamily predicted ATPase
MNTEKAEFRRQLDVLPSWQQRAHKIDEALEQTSKALATRQETLQSLRTDFAELERDFWKVFARGKGCENPTETLLREHTRLRSVLYLGTMALVAALTVYFVIQAHDNTPAAVTVCVIGLAGISAMIGVPLTRIARARKMALILAREQEPFWLTGGSIGLSSCGTTWPAEAHWWWKERIALVFVRHVAVRFSIDALKIEPLWEDSLSAPADAKLRVKDAAEILRALITNSPRYRHLVDSFRSLAALEDDYTLLQNLKTEAEQGLAEEVRAAEERVTQLHAAQAYDQQSSPNLETSSPKGPSHSANEKASWDRLIIPQKLCENLQAYCRILRDYQGYQAAGVHLPKGLLLYGPPGCGKTQIAKTLANETGLFFIALSTADCKVGWIGHAAAKIKEVFAQARAKEPTLLFIDELDAVCPTRGAYHDCISQEVTAQLLQEIDGLASDTQAIFLVGATNRPDQVDSAVLSRFTEQIEIPLPDASTRAALLTLFLSSLRFSGDKTRLIRSLALASAGKSGRDLRHLVSVAVLSGVKRCSSPRDFALEGSDFVLAQERT